MGQVFEEDRQRCFASTFKNVNIRSFIFREKNSFHSNTDDPQAFPTTLHGLVRVRRMTCLQRSREKDGTRTLVIITWGQVWTGELRTRVLAGPGRAREE